MPKVKNLTAADIKNISDLSGTLVITLFGANRQLEYGYCDTIETAGDLASEMLSLSLAAGRMAQLMLHKKHEQEQIREIEALHLKAGLK